MTEKYLDIMIKDHNIARKYLNIMRKDLNITKENKKFSI